MIQTITHKVILGTGDTAVDISEYISMVRYRRSIDKDNYLEMRTQGTSVDYLLSLSNFYTNTPVVFSYGYLNGEYSPARIVIIADIEPEYDGRGGTNLMIRCVDKGNTMKKVTSKRVWENKSNADIVAEIAHLHGLNANVQAAGSAFEDDPKNKIWESLPQANMNNMQLVQYLASTQKNNEYLAFVDDDTLHFKPIGTGNKSTDTIDIVKSGKVNRFSIRYREVAAQSGVGLTQVSLNNAKEKKNELVTAMSLNLLSGNSFLGMGVLLARNGLILTKEATEKNLQAVPLNYDISAVTGQVAQQFGINWTQPTPSAEDNATKVSPTKSDKPFVGNIPALDKLKEKDFMGAIGAIPETLQDLYSMGDMEVVPSAMPTEEASSRGKKKHHRNTRKVLTATLVLYGDPTRKLDSVLTIIGAHDRFNGNWYVENITDDVSGYGYTTTIELSKNATNVGNNTVAAKKVNKEKGPDKVQIRREIKISAVDGTVSDGLHIVPENKTTINNK